jgi:hypothetical protein
VRSEVRARSRREKRLPRTAARRLTFGVVVTIGALLLSGCLGTGFTYVSHRNPDGTVLYFKVPDHWKIFNQDQIILSSNPALSRSQLSQIEGSRWLEAFTVSPHPSVKNALNLQGSYPTGFAEARQLNVTERQSYSLSSLRSEILGTDPLSTGSPDTPLAYSEFTGANGMRGSRMTVLIPSTGGKFDTYEQIAEVDGGTNWIFIIAVGCTATCWRPNEGLLNQLLDSWAVKAIGKT